MSNQEQIEFWNSEVADSWVRNQVLLDSMLKPLGLAGIKALEIEPGFAVLDVGCGAGDTSIELSKQGAEVTGVDISAPLLACARQRASEAGVAVNFLESDASVAEFDTSFDRVFSRFGVMFFDDTVQAFNHIRGLLNPGARLGFVCWRSPMENDWIAKPMAIIMSHVEVPAGDPDAPGPFAFANEDKVRGILESAGFNDVNLDRFDADIQVGAGDAESALHFIEQIGPAARLLADADEDVVVRIRKKMLDLFEEERGSEGIAMGAGCWIVTATA